LLLYDDLRYSCMNNYHTILTKQIRTLIDAITVYNYMKTTLISPEQQQRHIKQKIRRYVSRTSQFI